MNTSIKIAGDDFDDAIVRYVRKKHNLLIGERTAEDIKIKIGSTYPLVEEESMEVTGRNLMTGLAEDGDGNICGDRAGIEGAGWADCRSGYQRA